MEALYKEIPELQTAALIALPLTTWQKLDDFRFIVLYNLISSPNTKLECYTGPKATRYIERRRRLLGLNKAAAREQTKEDASRIFKPTNN